MSKRLSVSLSSAIRLLVDAMGIKNSGTGILVPIDFGLQANLYDDDAKLFELNLKQNPNLINELESKVKGLIIENDESYLSISLRKTEFIYIASNSNYISVYSSIIPEKSVNDEFIEVEGRKLKLLVSHDSCWRIDGIEAFEKMFSKSLYEDIDEARSAAKISSSTFSQQYFGSGLERIVRTSF